MKKMSVLLIMALVVGGLAVAQPGPGAWGPQNRPLPPAFAQPQGELVKVDGTLSLINGRIGLKSGGKTYYVPMLGRYAGFIEGLKEGAYVKLEGYEFPYPIAPEYSMLRVTKLTVGGKDYDFSQLAYGYGHHGGMMGRRW
jgi:hypothetical protein